MAASCRMQIFLSAKEEHVDGGGDRKAKAVSLSLGKEKKRVQKAEISSY